MRKIRGILFDKDGTLVSFHRFWIPFTKDLILLSFDKVGADRDLLDFFLERLGVNPIDETLIPGGSLADDTTEDIFQLLGDLLIREGLLKEEDRQEFTVYLNSQLEALTRRNRENIIPVTDLVQLLGTFQEEGIILGIATLDSRNSTQYFLEYLHVSHFFSYVGCGDDNGSFPKPHPYHLNTFAQKTGLKTEEIAVVGDNLGDLLMAHEGKALAIGVLTGISDYAKLYARSHYIIDSISHLYQSKGGFIWEEAKEDL